MINFLVHCRKIPARVVVFHFYSNLKFSYLISLSYDYFLCNVDTLDIFRYYFLRQQNAVTISLVAFFLFRLCTLDCSPYRVFDI